MKKKILYAAIAILLIANIKTIYDLENMSTEINNITNSIQSLHTSINSIQSNISNTVNQIYEDKKWLYNLHYEISDLSKDLQEISISLNWSIRELGKDTKVYLLYGAENQNDGQVVEWKEVPAEDLGNLNYKLQLRLPFQKDYQFKVVVKGNENVISEKLTDIKLLSFLNNRISIEPTPNEKTVSNSNANLNFQVRVTNRYNFNIENYMPKLDENLLKIKNINIGIYNNDTLKKEITIMKDGKITDEKAKYDEPFKNMTDVKMQEILYNSSIQYTITTEPSYDTIEVIVEDFIGRKYTKKSHKI